MVAALLVPAVLVHEPVFGEGVGLRAAGAGAATGLLLAAASTRWRWDLLTTAAVTIAAHLLLGGPAALPQTLRAGFLPGADTLQALLVQPVHAWKDLLTLSPPAASYTGPAVLPWVTGLVCALAAGLLTARAGRVVLGTLPIAVMGLIGIAWGPSGTFPPTWPVALWGGAVLAWWSWVARRRRLVAGEDVLVGRRALRALHPGGPTSASSTTTGHRIALVHTGRQVLLGGITIAVAMLLAVPVAGQWAPGNGRVVLRDLVAPPLDMHEYPSPLAAFRHYTTDLEDRTLITVSSLPEGARVRLAVMDTYDGIAFGMSDPQTSGVGGYTRVGSRLPEPDPVTGATALDVDIHTEGLLGPWVPLVGVPDTLEFSGDSASDQQDGLHLDAGAGAALTTGPAGTMTYSTHTTVVPVWSDGQLAGVDTPPITGTPDTHVPDGVAELAQEIAATEQTPLGRARAIERHLSREGYFSNSDTAQSRPGHRADRLARMLDADQMIGDDEQYATLMALMLRSLGMPARVVMGAYPDAAVEGPVELRGSDVHAWVEVEFEGVGWARFDPTPPKDQVPQTDVPRPRSVPRPQVLQPPEPPEEPVELPPSTTDRSSDPGEEEGPGFPWGIVLGASGGVLVLVAPVFALLVAKGLRRRRRRRRADPALAVSGSWEETLDLARDAGARISPDLTRQESAWLLSTTLWEEHSGEVGQHPWHSEDSAAPGIVELARLADTASFSEEGPAAEDVVLAWAQESRLRRDLARAAGPFTRIRRRLSLRSLRRARAGRPSRRRSR